MDSRSTSAEEIQLESHITNRKETHRSESHFFVGNQPSLSPNLTENGMAWNSLESTPNLKESSSMLWPKEYLRSTEKTIPTRWQSIKLWGLEISAVLVILLSLSVLTKLLSQFQGKPLSAWPYPFPISAVVSVFTTLLKGAVSLVVAEGLNNELS